MLLLQLGLVCLAEALKDGLPVLTLLSLEPELKEWEQHCECLEPYTPATWGMMSAWSCPVAALQPHRPECGVQCYDEHAKLLSTLCPKNFVYLDCECRFVLPGDTVPFSGVPQPVTLPSWPALLETAFCARACQQNSALRRFGTNGYACELNTSAPVEIQELCFSGCGGSPSQLQQWDHDVDFDELEFEDIAHPSRPVVPLVFLCPNKRSAGCGAHDYCPTHSCPQSTEAHMSYELKLLELPNETLRVVADTANERMLLGSYEGLGATCLGIVWCAGSFPLECVPGARLLFEGESPSCECRLALPCMAKYARSMIHMLVEWRERRPPPADFRVLVIGFGTSLLSVVSQRVTNSTVESVDIEDLMLRDVAIPFFGYDAFHPHLHFSKEDCFQAVQRRAQAGLDYDAVLVDAFAMDGTVPLACRSLEFLHAASAILERRQGLLMHNIWTRHPESALGVRESHDALLRDYHSHFSGVQQQAFSVFPKADYAHQVVIAGGPFERRFLSD